jgi:hypothetical protein
MLHVLNAQILAGERERAIQRDLRDLTLRREAEAALATEATRRFRTPGPPEDRRCADCPALPAGAR